MNNLTLITSLYPTGYTSKGYIICDTTWYDYVNGVKNAAGTKIYPYLAQNNVAYMFCNSTGTQFTYFSGTRNTFTPISSLNGSISNCATQGTCTDSDYFFLTANSSVQGAIYSITPTGTSRIFVSTTIAATFYNAYLSDMSYNGGIKYNFAYTGTTGINGVAKFNKITVSYSCSGYGGITGRGLYVDVDPCFVRVICLCGKCLLNVAQGYIQEGSTQPQTGTYWTSSSEISSLQQCRLNANTYTFVSNSGWLRCLIIPSTPNGTTGFVCRNQYLLPDYGGNFTSKLIGANSSWFYYKGLSNKTTIYETANGASTSATYTLHEDVNCEIKDFAIYGVNGTSGIFWIDCNNILYNYSTAACRNLSQKSLGGYIHLMPHNVFVACQGYDIKYLEGTSSTSLLSIGSFSGVYSSY